jgi:serine/threonine protein kinase
LEKDDLISSKRIEQQDSGGPDSLVGNKIVDRYTILTRIAKGGTAVVYRALDTVLNREVAVKIIHEHLERKEEIVGRFKKEAVMIAQLRHANIVTVFDFLEYRGRAVLVVEFMPGITLSALVNSTEKIHEDIVLMITLNILNGLRVAHEKGMTHRDIKPANILVHSELGVKISDFGLAKIMESDDQLTKTGIFVGTPSFSSPEQIEGRPVDHRSDLFSLGLTMYMLATRSHAFKNKGDSTTTVWYKTVRGTFESARERNPALSEAFEKIVNRSLEVSLE